MIVYIGTLESGEGRNDPSLKNKYVIFFYYSYCINKTLSIY